MIDETLITPLTDAFGRVQQSLFENAVQPAMFALGMGNLLEDAYAATGWLLVGLIQLALMLCLIAPLQRWRPVEYFGFDKGVRADVIYTLLHRLGIFRVAMFFSIDPLLDTLFGQARVHGVDGIQLDALIASWSPGLTDTAWASFALYLVVFDLVDYWIHRGQHRVNGWWALHAVHHSQRHMTMWSDNRNHLLDDIIRDLIIAFTARAIGVPPGQFVAVVAVTQLIENLSHANARLNFGWLGERLLVGPRFHRLHHSIGLGHEGDKPGSLGGCNFAVLFPVWDVLFGTARFDGRFEPTGIRDQLPGHGPMQTGRDYGEGFWAQQWLGLKRLIGQA
ncbi:MAG: fatty acid hydroxylase family protein [Aquabacterium sp.]|uniref:sterol desaturase family protein n=1 Tax=Aquabacterium sp. TaxID=1872578 RepID=UPI0011FD7937|nr:sterol desaturase family protein [Aquabacterium sp.]TAK94160.1 MAG: fatty acid hydroxylase family protein [Aquabacterium sp.]